MAKLLARRPAKAPVRPQGRRTAQGRPTATKGQPAPPTAARPAKGAKRGRQPNSKGTRLAAPGPLTPSGLTGKPAAAEVVRVLAVAERRAKAAELKVHHRLSYTQIAERLGVSAYTVAKDLEAMYEQWRESFETDTKVGRAMEARRLDQSDRVLIPIMHEQTGVKNPVVRKWQSLSAIRELRANSKHRSELFGYFAPVKIAQTNPAGDREYGSLTEAELDALLSEREMALGLKPVIDVTPSATGHVLALPANGDGHHGNGDGGA